MKPTLSRNEKDVVDHKITQPHLSEIRHMLTVGASLRAPTACGFVPLHTHMAMSLQKLFYYSCQELECGVRRFKITIRFWLIFFPMS